MNLKSLEPLQRRIGHFPIELPAATLMAVALALVTIALPQWRFEGLVTASGLPGVIAAAQPPLGQTARFVVALVLAGLSFAAVFYGLRALDRRPAETDFPTFRAADLHPDAPRRRPILAGAEFGAPADDIPPVEQQLLRRKLVPAEPLPSFLAPQPAGIGDFVPEALSPVHPAKPQASPFAPDTPQQQDNPPVRSPLPAADDFMQDPDPVAPEFDASDVQPAAARVASEPIRPVSQFPVPAPAPAPVPVAAPVAPPAPPAAKLPPALHEAEESVVELMARLESGLARRDDKPQPSGSAYFAQEELQRALGDLNRVVGRAERS